MAGNELKGPVVTVHENGNGFGVSCSQSLVTGGLDVLGIKIRTLGRKDSISDIWEWGNGKSKQQNGNGKSKQQNGNEK